MVAALSTPPRDPLTSPVLVLNRSYQPVRVTTARQAFVLLFGGRARAVDERHETYDFERWARLGAGPEDDAIGTPSGAIRLPRLLLLVGYARVPRSTVRLSRRNVFLRDRFTCQYCSRTLPQSLLNLDHVLPRSRGGLSTWDNLVTSCRECNLRKGGALLHETSMRLRRRPFRPNWSLVVQVTAATHRRFREWEAFLPAADEVAAE